jgi:hypothetical protein
MKKNLFLVFFLFFFHGCGGGGASTSSSVNETLAPLPTTPTSSILIGYINDSFINGIEYRCGELTGITGEDGRDGSFRFKSDCTVEFYIGKVHLGDINGSLLSSELTIFPANIVDPLLRTSDINNTKVINFARFVQSLDSDNNTSNGITIDAITRTKLSAVNVDELDLTLSISTDHLTNTFLKAFPSRTLKSATEAITHLSESLTNANFDINSTKPATPYILNPITFQATTVSQITSSHITKKTFLIHGEPTSKIWVAYNTTGNTPASIDYVDKNLKLNSNWTQSITFDFSDVNTTSFNYFIKLQDNAGNFSDPYRLNLNKDITPPHVENTNIIEQILEEQLLFRNIHATDSGGIKNYRIVSLDEDLRSVNHEIFTIDSNGTVTFKVAPNFDENLNAIFKVVTRAVDFAGNMTDLLLQVILKNILDNPPVLTATNYTTSIIEGLPNGSPVFDLNTTLEQNLTIAPDNDPTLSPIYFHLNNYTTIFDINKTTGIITIKDANNSLFDYEQLPNTIDLNISVENNNSHPSNDINTTYATLTVNITNKIDTTPTLIIPSPLSIPEESSNYTSDYPIGGILIDEPSSDRNFTMTFSIESGNIGNNFSIDPINGRISVKNSNTLDYETTKLYTLIIRATNTWWNGTTHYDEVNQDINITDVRDNAPSIVLETLDDSIPESTLANVTIATFDVNGTIDDANVTTSYTIKDATLKNDVYITPSSIPFTINNSGVLSTSRQLLNDYVESLLDTTDTVFRITIEALNTWWDGSTGTSNPITFDINITNISDNSPIISIASTSIYFDENTTIGTQIYDVNTSGTTYDTNRVTNFSIVSGNSDNKFSINATTGVITLANSLDWETTTSYSLWIKASNIYWDGSEYNSSIQNLAIKVNNIIEKVPSIYVPNSISLHENIDDGYVLTTLEINSTKVDEQSLSNITLTASPNDGNFILSTDDINSSIRNIKVNLNNTIDYEDRATSYDLNITATNNFGSKSYPLHINIIDDVDKDLPMLVIAIEYADLNLTTTEEEFETLFFTELTSKTRVSDYFSIVSKNKFSIIPADENSSIHNNGIVKITFSDRNYTTSPTQLVTNIKDAITLANNYVNFAAYDKDSDGSVSSKELEYIFIIAGGENTYDSYDTVYNSDANKSITASISSFMGKNINLDGKNILGDYSIIGENIGFKKTTIGLVCKLIGENILKFKKATSNYVFRDFDLMDKGFLGYDNNNTVGFKPMHPSVYNKSLQGWINPKLLRRGASYNLELYNTHDNDKKFDAVRINVPNSNIYYLIENRNKTLNGAYINYDNGIDGLITSFNGGLVIWEIDLNNSKISIVPILNTTNNVFRPDNTVNDLPSAVRSIFEFTNVGTIEGDTNVDGTKKYSITIKVN